MNRTQAEQVVKNVSMGAGNAVTLDEQKNVVLFKSRKGGLWLADFNRIRDEDDVTGDRHEVSREQAVLMVMAAEKVENVFS